MLWNTGPGLRYEYLISQALLMESSISSRQEVPSLQRCLANYLVSHSGDVTSKSYSQQAYINRWPFLSFSLLLHSRFPSLVYLLGDRNIIPLRI